MHACRWSGFLGDRTRWFLIALSVGIWPGGGHAGGQGASPAGTQASRATVTLLYHRDPEVRMTTIRALAVREDPDLIDDLIRAYTVELRVDVWNVYEQVLRPYGSPTSRGPSAWKSWLQTQVDAGQLTIDYQPIAPPALDPNQRANLDPLALQLDPQHFAHFAETVRSGSSQGRPSRDRMSPGGPWWDAMRYFIANDHLDPVREFLGGEFLHQCLARREVDLIPVAQFLGCVADPSPLRERINEQVRRCLASDDPTLVANTLRLLAGVEGARAGAFKVPGIADRIRPLLGSPHFAVSTQAQRALLRINPRDLTPGTVRAPLANVALLYHQDPEVRTAAIRALAGGRDPGIIDDLIRACTVETYRFVRNAYDEVLTAWIGPRPRSPWAWKAWLQSQVASGKVTIDYQPIVVADLDPNQRAHLDPLALRLGPEHFAHFAGVIRRKRAPEAELRNALRYMVANDHLDPVREFLGAECVSLCLAQPDVESQLLLGLLGYLAAPGPLCDRIHDQLRRCLDADDPTTVAHALQMLTGEQERDIGFQVSGVADRIRTLLASPHPMVAAEAQLALRRIEPHAVLSDAAAPAVHVAFLYHKDPEVRTATIRALAARQDPGVVDDLIRAYGTEIYTPVRNVYREALGRLTGQRLPDPAAWKSWLQTQVAAGKLTLDYRPVVPATLDSQQRENLDPLALQLGPEHFDRFAEALRGRWSNGGEFWRALRYMVANDHLPQVREFLGSEWLGPCLARKDADISILLFLFHSWTDPDPLRARLHDQVRRCLQADDPMVLANTLHLLAGFDGGLPGLDISGVEERVHALVASPHPTVAAQARRAANPRRLEVPDMSRRAGREDAPAANRGDSGVSYAEALRDLHAALGRQYPCFELKGIDWEAVGRELLPRVESVKTDEEFGLLCLELVARLQDSHALLMKGSADVPQPAFPVWDGGFACLDDDQGRAVVYFLVPEGPAAQAGLTLGQIVTHVNDQPAATAIEKAMRLYRTYAGYSSQRYLRYHALRFFARQDTQNAPISLSLVDTQGKQRRCQMRASLKAGYVPRLPVPIPGIEDAGSVSWKRLDDEIGYIYVRRVGGDLIEKLDQAVGEFQTARGLIIDVRGNSGGGFDSDRAHRNFFLDEVGAEPNRPRFRGPLALLVDERCISAGEGWASWFIARQRARVFGQTTAGASSRKIEYTLKNGLYRVSLPVKAYTGYLNRPIEFRGLEPDVPVRPKAEDLARGRDTVLLAAQSYLLTQPSKP